MDQQPPRGEKMPEYPTIHSREAKVRSVEQAIRKAYRELVEKHGLTTAEELRVLSSVFGSEVGTIAKYAIRQERHGDTSTPGGLEG